MDVYIFILCYNEEILLPHTVAHYRANIPDCHIIIYDNYSTDNSVAIAKLLNCAIVQWKSKDLDDGKYIKIKNNCWKHIKNGWIICADMDEWLCITDNELLDEYIKGTTVLRIKGINMLGNSKHINLNDINLHTLSYGVDYILESKKLCFLVPDIKDVNYITGAHHAFFTGNIKYSKKIYINKHMEFLGLPYYLNKKKNRYNRLNNYKFQHFYLKYIDKRYSPNASLHEYNFNKHIKKAKKIKNIINKTIHDEKLLKTFMKFFLDLLFT